nr:zinc finger, CCHC-type [Tanacetum cinerariifolium]
MIEESLKAQDNDKCKGKVVAAPIMNMTEEGGLVTSKGIIVVVKRTTQMLVVQERGLRTNPKTKVDAIAWWIDSGAITHVCKDRCWFKTYESVEDRSLLYMGDDYFALFHGKRSVVLKICTNLIYGPVLNKCGYKQVYESDKYILSKFDVFVGFGYYNNDAIFDENHFFSIPRPKDIITNSVESQRDDHCNDIPSGTPEPRKGKRVRKAKSYGFDFHLDLVEGLRDKVESQYSYCYSIKEDPRTYNEAMQSRDVAF